MKSNLWSKIKWFVGVWYDLRKNLAWKAVYGTRLLLASAAFAPISLFVSVFLPPEFQIERINIQSSYIDTSVLVINALLFIIGFLLIFIEVLEESRSAKRSARVVINGLPDTPLKFPNEVLSKSEKRFAREPVELSFCDKAVLKQITRYNAEVCVELFKRFVLHDHCEKIYIGGLARIPFLVAYGKFLRNVSNIHYFDKINTTSNWRLLDDEDLGLGMRIPEHRPNANSNGDIGIALGFSTSICEAHLPASLKDSVLFVRPTTSPKRNLLLNQDNLHRLSDNLLSIIDELSGKHTVKKIHLFLSVQSSFAIEIGRKFQEGVHKPWVIHNFNATLGQYEWALELTESGVKKHEAPNTKGIGTQEKT